MEPLNILNEIMASRLPHKTLNVEYIRYCDATHHYEWAVPDFWLGFLKRRNDKK